MVIGNPMRTWFYRLYFNFFPAYRGTGARVIFIAPDFKQIKIKIPLNWRTRNYVGTIFGGSIYGSVDPMYMLMLIKLLGPNYTVWDKGATIHFKRPGRKTLYATFILTDEEMEEIKTLLEVKKSIDRTFHIDIVDDNQLVHASIDKVIYLSKRGT